MFQIVVWRLFCKFVQFYIKWLEDGLEEGEELKEAPFIAFSAVIVVPLEALRHEIHTTDLSVKLLISFSNIRNRFPNSQKN